MKVASPLGGITKTDRFASAEGVLFNEETSCLKGKKRGPEALSFFLLVHTWGSE